MSEGSRAASGRRGFRPTATTAAPYLFILPFFLVFLPFGAGAILLAIAMSFASWPIGQSPSFVGTQNFAKVLVDPLFRTGMFNTTRMLIAYMLVLLPLALFVAVSLRQLGRRSANIFQIVVFAPLTMSLVSVSIIFVLLMQDQVGLINATLVSFGLPSIPFFSDAGVAPWAIVAMRVWRVLGYYAILLYAGLQTIPDDLYEAAAIDGANALQKLWNVTLPMLQPVILFVAVSASVSAWEVFAEPNVLTNGGPARSTYTAVMYVFEVSYGRLDLGRGAAAAALLAAAIVATTFLLTRMIRSRAHD